MALIAMVGFDTAKARVKDKGARLGSVKLSSPAIGLALTADGATLIASNGQTLTFIDAARIHQGDSAIKSVAPSSGPGRELFITNNRTLLLTNNAASILEIFDLSKVLR